MSSLQPPARRAAPVGPSSAPVFLALRRMRTPLVLVIAVYAVSVGGLMLIPGVDAAGNPDRMDAFEAFYFMSYTATTIGFGEIPDSLTTPQRAWVVVVIYASVIAWAYAFATAVSLLQERGFREALRLSRFERRVRRMREPFLLVAGFGRAGELLARSLDAMDRRLVVIDIVPERIDALDLAALQSDVPGLLGDASSPVELRRAGLQHDQCQGVVALTDDDEANLAVVMTAALLRPGLPVVTRATHAEITARMAAFDSALIVDPFNLFGDELMLAVRDPALYRLLQWLGSQPGARLLPAFEVPPRGRWVIAGYGRFGRHFADDLVRHGIAATVIDPHPGAGAPGLRMITGVGDDPAALAEAGIADAVAFAAATDSDLMNLSMIRAARLANPSLHLIARQNDPVNHALFDALDIGSVLVPTELVAQEVLQRIGSPLLWRFMQLARQQDVGWAEPLLERLQRAMGGSLDSVWDLTVDPGQCPAVVRALAAGDEVDLGMLLRDPEDRDQRIDAVPLLIERGGGGLIGPPDGQPVQIGDRLLFAGTATARGILETTVTVPTALAYTATGRRTGDSWVWRSVVDRRRAGRL